MQPQPLTVQTQREKTEKLNILFEREERLKDSQHSLNRFSLAADEDSNTVEIRDRKGIFFRTGNPNLVKLVLEDIKNALASSIAKVEADIIAIG